MTRLVAISALLLLLVQAFVPSATVLAQDPACEFSVTLNLVTLPATDIAGTTAELHGRLSAVYVIDISQDKPSGPVSPLVFQYGDVPGVFQNQVIPEVVPGSFKTDIRIEGERAIMTMSEEVKASVQDLSPCTLYYVRLRVTGAVPFDAPCFKLNQGSTVEFRTEGCRPTVPHQAGGVTSAAARPLLMSNIVVKSAAVSQSRVGPGENVDVTATLANKGGSNGTARITLYVNGQEADSRGVTVTGGETTPVHFFTSRGEPGTYQVYVNGTPAGSFTVDALAGNDILIYGVIALFVVGIAGALYFLVRRRNQAV